MLSEYDIIDDRLGKESAPENAARQMIHCASEVNP